MQAALLDAIMLSLGYCVVNKLLGGDKESAFKNGKDPT